MERRNQPAQRQSPRQKTKVVDPPVQPPPPPQTPLQIALTAASDKIVRLIMKGKVKVDEHRLNFRRGESLNTVRNRSKEWLHEKL